MIDLFISLLPVPGGYLGRAVWVGPNNIIWAYGYERRGDTVTLSVECVTNPPRTQRSPLLCMLPIPYVHRCFEEAVATEKVQNG